MLLFLLLILDLVFCFLFEGKRTDLNSETVFCIVGEKER